MALHLLILAYISDLLNFKTYSRSLRSPCKEYLVVPSSTLDERTSYMTVSYSG